MEDKHTAFLLAAGFGTRLRPLTLHRPKPLLPLLGTPMLDYALEMLRRSGHSRIIANAHHLWEQVAAWAEQRGVSLQVELPGILGTGGGLRAARPRLASKFLVWNGDIVADIDPGKLYDACPEGGASMALRYSEQLGRTTRLDIDPQGRVAHIGSLCSLPGAPPLASGEGGLHFTGIHAMASSGLDCIPEGMQCIVRTSYCRLVPEGGVAGVVHRGFWRDAGTPEEYLQANLDALDSPERLPFLPEGKMVGDRVWMAGGESAPSASKRSVIGKNAEIASGATLDQCVVWDGAIVPPGEHRRTVFHDGGALHVPG
jgi:mannose-1-phosphate guanylyltransferase